MSSHESPMLLPAEADDALYVAALEVCEKSFFAFIERDRPFGAVSFALEVSPKNQRAHALYESLGFEDRYLRMMTRRLTPRRSRS